MIYSLSSQSGVQFVLRRLQKILSTHRLNCIPPDEVKTIAELQSYKQAFMVASQKKFNVRHSWFSYRKIDLFSHLGSKINVPEVLFYGKVKDFDLKVLTKSDKLPFVIKRNLGHSSCGVWAFTWDEIAGNYVEMLHREQSIALQDLLGFLDRKETIVVETYIGCPHEPIPLDFKVLLYDYKPQAVMVIDRNAIRRTITFVNADDLAIIPPETIYYEFPATALQGRQLSTHFLERVRLALEFAQKEVAPLLSISSLFVSIDTYVTHCGCVPYLGEITVKSGIICSPWIRPDIIRNWFGITFPNLKETVIR